MLTNPTRRDIERAHEWIGARHPETRRGPVYDRLLLLAIGAVVAADARAELDAERLRLTLN